ncbi:uncharacterized protein EV420DRAFT_1256776 [Desarmillaria tabescens]|uniref:Uncharacterized protein n=1 Tax=Armillaria tabescens TaxID=1929756 RepID=A0AA39TTE4_ARMTA|nr:uncharacterized protein EV420DRAFT_1256776 [Desarmillaria tabescens]KAK0469602.1 hypothetical protein EV420DRAFT_1256776 [Desarmillaria tabescens]
MLKGMSFAFWYALDVVHQAVRFLRQPLSFLVFLWVLAFLFGKISGVLQMALQPFCIIPGISHSSLCVSPSPHARAPKQADFSALVEVQSATFEQLLDGSVDGSMLSLDLRKAEMATSNLAALVRVSQLKSRERLNDALSNFIGSAKEAAIGLQRFSSHVQYTVDRIIAVNDYSLNTIEEARAKDGKYSLQSLIPWSSPTSSHEMILKTFSESMDILSQMTEILILKAQVQLKNLEDLEGNLIVINDIIVREDSEISADKAELLAALWTYLGGNRNTLREYDHRLGLLKNMSEYREKALRHVYSELHKLHEMSGNIEVLREHVSEPALLGSFVPPEVHIKSIKKGLERLETSNRQARERERDARKLLA